jgi:hypothetical protein
VSTLHTLIVPPTAHYLLFGVKAIRVGARSVRVQLEGATYRMPRSALPAVLPQDASLCELARKAARDVGVECDAIVPEVRP